MTLIRNRAALLVALLATVLAGCADRAGTRPVFQHRDDLNYRSPAEPAPEAASETTADPTAGARPPGTVFVQGSGKLIDEPLAGQPRPALPPVGEATFNFEGESLLAVIKAILGDLLQMNYIIAPEIQGTVTLSTPRPVSADQALSLLEMVLAWNNARMVWSDGRYNIVSADKAVPGNVAPRVGPGKGARGFEVRAVPLHFIAALEMEKLLKPFARPDAVLSVDPGRNLIVVAGTASELDNYLRTIQIFDVDWLAGMSVGIFPLRAQEAGRVVDQLNQVFGEKGGTPLSGMLRFMPLDGINAVMVITHQPKYLEDAEQWIQRIDLGGEGSSLFVYEVKYAKATDLADQLNQVFGSGGSSRSGQRAADPFNVSPGLQPVQVRTLENGAPSSPPAAPAAAGSGGAIRLGNTENVFISAVEDSNALLVRASPGQWDAIRRAIDRLDQMPLQVHIEAQIVEVKLNKNLSYGVSWFFGNAITGATDSGGVTPGSPLALSQTLNDFRNTGSAVSAAANNFTFIGPSAQAVVNMLDSVSDVTVLSAPSVLVRNNVEAQFNSGQQIPVASTIINPVLGGGTGDNTNINASQVQFRNTGVVLTVKPRASTDGSVLLEVNQTVSSPSNGGPVVGGNVSVDTNDVKTEVMVRSGETVIIAGLIKTTQDKGSSGLPLLNRIPLIGGLFGGQSEDRTRSELVVLITPTLVRNPVDLRKLTDEYGRRFRALEPLPASNQTDAAQP